MESPKKHIAAFIFVTIVALVLAELMLRLLTSFIPLEIDPVLGALPKVGIKTDAKGFFNDKVLAAANVVTLGDSMTTGANATRPESWPQVLAKLATTSVYNMAVGSYGPVQYAAQLDQAFLLQPKVVIVGFFFGSDMKDAYDMAYENEYWKSLRDPSFVSAHPLATGSDCSAVMDSRKAQWRCFLTGVHRWLKVNVLTYSRLGDVTRSLRDMFTERNPVGTALSVSDPRIGTVLISTGGPHSFDLSDPATREGWRMTKTLFKEMERRVAAHGARFIILMIPQKEEIYAEYYKAKGEKVPPSLLEYSAPMVKAHDEIRQYCLREHLECVDAFPDLVSALLGGRKLYADNPDQSHPISGGYRVIGETIASYLRK